jgi:hypothetical protein
VVSIIVTQKILHSDRGFVVADTIHSFAPVGCDPVGDLYLLGSESAVCVADGCVGPVVLV